MREKQLPVWVLLVCFCISCVLCIWAWLFAWQLLLVLPILPAFFLQVLARRGGKEWKWLLYVHTVILLCFVGLGAMLLPVEQGWDSLYGMLMLAGGVCALAGCLVEWIIHRVRSRKDKGNEA